MKMIWKRYFFDRRKVIGMYVHIIVIFLLICNLNQLDNFLDIFYAVVITSFLGICYGIYDYIQYYSRYKELKIITNGIGESFDYIPLGKNLIEESYVEIIRKLEEERRRVLSKKEEKETEMKDYYTMWAHQIKTPIAALKLLLHKEELQSKMITYSIMEELFKIEQYVEMVLQYLRLENMSSDLILKEYELKEIVNQVVKKYGVLFINRHLSFQLEEFQKKVLTDEKWLSLILEQLISNAVKYTPSGGISIYLEEGEHKIEEGEKRVDAILVIKDTGIGIRKEDQPRIFEKGFTGYNGRMNKKSTGIGLYLCKQAADKLSHKIVMTSEIEKGTIMKIYFYRNDETRD